MLPQEWTLFLDRDGVINTRLMGDYVKNVEEFEFLPGVLEAIAKMTSIFGRIVVVTNQQGIGKGLMTENDLAEVHSYMQNEVVKAGGKIDKVYYCPELESKKAACRKPNTGMAEEARKDFPEIDFKRSIMVGDSISDMEFGKRVGMLTVFISDEDDKPISADRNCKSLKEFSNSLD